MPYLLVTVDLYGKGSLWGEVSPDPFIEYADERRDRCPPLQMSEGNRVREPQYIAPTKNTVRFVRKSWGTGIPMALKRFMESPNHSDRPPIRTLRVLVGYNLFSTLLLSWNNPDSVSPSQAVLEFLSSLQAWKGVEYTKRSDTTWVGEHWATAAGINRPPCEIAI
jgi:hypothetical protein